MRQELFRKLSASLSAAVLVFGLSAPQAAEARTEFYGGGSVYDFQGCEAYGWQGVSTVKARFRPADLPGNGDSAALSLFWDTFAMGLQTRGGNFDDNFQVTDGGKVASGMNQFGNHGPDETRSRVRITRQQPNTLSGDTDMVRLQGIIRNFDGLRGCTARFALLVHQR